MKTPAAVAVASPCISLCQMDGPTGWCQGCLRTLDEITAWGGMDDGGRRRVLQQLRARRLAWRARLADATGPAGPDPTAPP